MIPFTTNSIILFPYKNLVYCVDIPDCNIIVIKD